MGNRLGAAIRRSAVAGMVASAISAGVASAALLDRGSALIYDDVLDITWTRNANLAGRAGFDWAGAHAWAANLVYAGYDDWRLPYASVSGDAGPLGPVVPCEIYSEVACLDNEMGYMYYYNLAGRLLHDKTGNQTAVGGQQLRNIRHVYWTDTPLASFGSWFFSFEHGGQNVGPANANEWSAWAVRPGDSRYVPEPSSAILIGAGMLVLMWTCSARRSASSRTRHVGSRPPPADHYACVVSPGHADCQHVMP